MLILTRRPGESIIIRRNTAAAQEGSEGRESLPENASAIKIRVLRVKGNQVSIGFDADKKFDIFREEIDPVANQNDDNIGNHKGKPRRNTDYDTGYEAVYTGEEGYY
jgi:carbon storage regulator CsrA